MYSPELTQKISDLRAKVAANNYDIKMVKEAIALMRQGRLAAQAAAKSKGSRSATKAPVDIDKLFGDLDKL